MEDSEDSSHAADNKVKLWRNLNHAAATNSNNVGKKPTTNLAKTFQTSSSAKYPFKAGATTSTNVRKDKSIIGI